MVTYCTGCKHNVKNGGAKDWYLCDHPDWADFHRGEDNLVSVKTYRGEAPVGCPIRKSKITEEIRGSV